MNGPYPTPTLIPAYIIKRLPGTAGAGLYLDLPGSMPFTADPSLARTFHSLEAAERIAVYSSEIVVTLESEVGS